MEIVTAETIGIEATTHVRNIFKCYVAYQLAADAAAEKEKVVHQAAPANK